MNDLRTAAQQAVVMLKTGMPEYDLRDVQDVLEAALAEPVAWAGYDLEGMVEAFSRVIEAHHSSKHPFHNPIDMDAKMALRILRGFIPAMKAYATPPQRPAEPVQEPVAWMVYTLDGKSVCVTDNPADFIEWRSLPLYTSPPQRKPLTREQAIALWADKSDGPSNGEIVSYCRAIEQAHGITE